MNIKQRRLPSEYKETEYLESHSEATTEGSSIDTGWHYSSDYAQPITIEAKVMQVKRLSGVALFGIQSSAWSQHIYWYNSANLIKFYVGGNIVASITDMSIGEYHTIKYEISLTNLNVWIDGVKVVDNISHNGDIDTTSSLHFFSGIVGTSMRDCSEYRICYFKIFEGDNLVRDYIPCCRVSDNELGMYDTVNNTFNTNASTVAFTQGENIVTTDTITIPQGDVRRVDIGGVKVWQRLPTLFQEVEYIESTGVEYIDTGHHFLYGDEFYFEYMKLYHYGYEDKGYGAGTNLSLNICGGGRQLTDIAMYIIGGNSYYSPTLAFNDTLNKKYKEHWKIENDVLSSTLKEDGTENTYTLSKSGLSSSYDSGNNVFICRDNSSRYPYPSAQRIYGCWLKRQNGEYAFNLIPCYRIADNEIGMYDLINGVFLTNQGTGTFIKGADL